MVREVSRASLSWDLTKKSMFKVINKNGGVAGMFQTEKEAMKFIEKKGDKKGMRIDKPKEVKKPQKEEKKEEKPKKTATKKKTVKKPKK